MVLPNRLLISLSASLLLVLAQVLVLDHVHEHNEIPSICAYCVSADSTYVGVAVASINAPVFTSSTTPPQKLRKCGLTVHSSYHSRAPPVISS